MYNHKINFSNGKTLELSWNEYNEIRQYIFEKETRFDVECVLDAMKQEYGLPEMVADDETFIDECVDSFTRWKERRGYEDENEKIEEIIRETALDLFELEIDY